VSLNPQDVRRADLTFNAIRLCATRESEPGQDVSSRRTSELFWRTTVLDHEIGDGFVAADFARRLRLTQPPTAPRDHAGLFQCLNALAHRLQFYRADSFLTHDMCTLTDARQPRSCAS